MCTEPLHVVWFKRDLRVDDHAPLRAAAEAGRVLPLFIWAPQVWQAEDASLSQAGFVRECLHALAAALQGLGLQLHVYHHDPLAIFQRLHEKFGIAAIYSHEETGNAATYALDRALNAWCQARGVRWQEWAQNGVVRRLKDRNRWHLQWESRMQTSPVVTPLQAQGVQLNHHGLSRLPVLAGAALDKPARQRGGLLLARTVLDDFLHHRVDHYRGGISSPLRATQACSRLSPYLAWGAIGLRQVVQCTRHAVMQSAPGQRRQSLHAFESRLHWHCHFMQKLETEPRIEFESFYPGFDQIRLDSGDALTRLHAWQQGQTGWPLVDACMAMLQSTGWLNFRMRAMLMSTASYLLWLPWRQSGLHLAREFVDYEPGIHWPQVQMQSGTTGINTLRIYHPVKQAMAQDARGEFVRHWLPALRQVPDSWIFEPWQMPSGLQQRIGCVIGRDYPAPMVDITQAMRAARQQLVVVRQALYGSGVFKQILEQHGSRAGAYFPRMQRGLPSTAVRADAFSGAQADLFT